MSHWLSYPLYFSMAWRNIVAKASVYTKKIRAKWDILWYTTRKSWMTVWNQASMKGKTINAPYSRCNTSQVIFKSLSVLEIPGESRNSQSCDADFTHVDSPCGLYAFSSSMVMFARRAPEKDCFWKTFTVFGAVKGELMITHIRGLTFLRDEAPRTSIKPRQTVSAGQLFFKQLYLNRGV